MTNLRFSQFHREWIILSDPSHLNWYRAKCFDGVWKLWHVHCHSIQGAVYRLPERWVPASPRQSIMLTALKLAQS